MKHNQLLSYQSLIRIAVVGIAGYLLWTGMSLAVMIVIALIISAALYPIATWLRSKRVPWLLSVVMVVMLLLIPIIAVIVITAVVFAQQFPQLVQFLDGPLSHLPFIPESLRSFDVSAYMGSGADYLVSSGKAIVGGVASIITVIFMSFYFIFDFDGMSKIFLGLFPKGDRPDVEGLFAEISRVTGHYIRGNLLISVICAAIIFAGLSIIGVPFALPLAIFAGIMDLLPFIGPILAMAPALLVAFAVSPLTGVAVLVLYVLYQQLENLIIVPFMYKKALNLSSGLVFLSVVVGGSLFGIVGAFLALPVAASIPVVISYKEDYEKRHHSDKSED